MTPEEANVVSDLRLRILQNQSQGLPPETGISKDELKKAIAFCRKDYQAAQSKSKAAGVSNPRGLAAPNVDLAALFTSVPSK